MGRKVTRTALRKTSVAVPSDVLDFVDREARLRKESRSRFVTRVLREAMRARKGRDITRQLDALFADPAIAEEQRAEADLWGRLFETEEPW
jgi:hypothetical protein